MSRSARFILKQIPVRGSGNSDLTRYVARSKLDAAHEGRAARPLFTAHEDSLTVAQARRWLSVTGADWQRADALHYVLSWAAPREYELLGADEPARRQCVTHFLRQSLQSGWHALGLTAPRWAAGVHRNTAHPHLHLLLNRHALNATTGELVRLSRLPAPLIAHYQRNADGAREFAPGLILDSFAAQTDAMLRARTRALHYESPLGTVRLTRALVTPDALRERPPTAPEILAGQWLLAELAAWPSALVSASRTSQAVAPTPQLAALRTAVTQLDQRAAQAGASPVPAYLPDQALRDVLLHPPAGARLTALTEVPAPTRQPHTAHELPFLASPDARAALMPARSEPIRPAFPALTRS